MTLVVGVPLEREFLFDGRVPAVEMFPEADAIVLLGGSMGIDTNLSCYAEMWTSADRAWQAARLYKAGKAGKIIATGDNAINTTLPLLCDLGVDKDAVSFLDARNTEEEANGIRAIFSRGERAEDGRVDVPRTMILLVTSAWHMKRARLMFEKYAPNIDVVCAPADFENSMMATRGLSVIPDFGAFAQNSVAFHEWLGYLGYKLLR